MTETQTIIREIEKGLPVLRDKYRIRKIGIFGSYLRGEQTRKSADRKWEDGARCRV